MFDTEKYLKRAEELRNDPLVHYNCTQAITVTFAEDCGISEEKAMDIGTFYGGGLKIGNVCGVITGGLMVLGMLKMPEGINQRFIREIRNRHEGMINCSDLLAVNAQRGGQKKPHCDAMVYEAIEIVCSLLNENISK